MKSISKELIAEHLSDDAMILDGFDDCIVGAVERFGMNPVLLYDTDKILEKLTSEDEMSFDEATEYFDFNILGAWMGDGTPCFSLSRGEH